MNYIIETQNLTKCYGEHAAVRNVSLHVPQGAIYGLLGRNGAGKTTVMKMLLGLARPTSGSILLFGRPVKGFPRDIYSRIGSSIEAPGFYPHMTAKENLTIFSRLTGKPDPSRIEQALDMVGLSSDSQKTFSQYSLGMKQRLALANALLKSPRLLILDEPANGLDPIGIAELRSLLKRLSEKEGRTILLSSHQLTEMEQLSDFTGVLHEGRLVEECSREELAQMEKKYIRLCVSAPDRALLFIRNTCSPDGPERILPDGIQPDGSIHLYGTGWNPAAINKKLLEAGFEVTELTRCAGSLEEHFKSITGGVGIA